VRQPPEFEPLYTTAEMRAAEARHPDLAELMERAGARAAEVALRSFADAQSWTVVCGGGANGGDGRIMARHLEHAGRSVRIVEAKAGETDLGQPDVLVDALFGTGFSGEPRAEAAALIERMNASEARRFSIDLPSGLDASTGEVAGAAVWADETVTFHGRKVGLVIAPGRFHAGTVHVADIGLTQDETEAKLATAALLHTVPRRREQDNKYTAGHVLVVGGSPGLTGAPSLSALAAMRADAGYVTLAAPEATLPVFEHRLLETVKRPLRGADSVLELAQKASSIAIGPGLGRGAEVHELVRRVLAEAALPAVVDADALFGLEPAEWPAARVLTPHEGELGRLLGRSSGEVAAHRLASVREAADRFRCTVLLKGPDTLVTTPAGGLDVASLGLPSLATAGTGDVLTGIVAAFLAKGMEPRRAALAAAVAQQRASALAPQRAGLVAGDLIDALPKAFD
jgi:ADP-dependent NAD(P)H-hydrate dehydratase / NAD(P)H-hydrate epimerase